MWNFRPEKDPADFLDIMMNSFLLVVIVYVLFVGTG